MLSHGHATDDVLQIQNPLLRKHRLRFSDANWHLITDETTLPAGKQEIVVIYTPPFFRFGLFISVATLFSTFALNTVRPTRVRARVGSSLSGSADSATVSVPPLRIARVSLLERITPGPSVSA